MAKTTATGPRAGGWREGWRDAWNRLRSVEWMILCIWLCGFGLWAMQDISDPDTPWHIATGRYILAHHLIPATDPFSWSMRGHPWVTQEWLFETELAWLINHFQFFGAWLLLFGVQFITLIALYRLGIRVSEGNRVIAAVTAVLGTLAGLIFWIYRPQIVSYMMFAIFLLILQKVRDGELRVLFAVPPLILIWTNSHGSASIGIIMLLLEVGLSFLPTIGRLERFRLPPGARWKMLAATVVGFGFGLVNPNGIKAFTYALLSTDPEMTNNITEWLSPNFHGQYFEHAALPFLIVCFLILLATRRPLPLRMTLYFGGAFAVTLIHQRFMPYVTIAAAPLLAASLSGVFRSLLNPHRVVRYANAVLSFAALFILGSHLPNTAGPVARHLSPGAYPVGAVDYMESHHLVGQRVLNAYHWGGYLIYRGVPPFIDGRTDLYLQNGTFANYLAMKNVYWNGFSLLKSYDFDILLFPPGYSIITDMENNPAWRVAYSDGTATLLVKIGSQAARDTRA